MTQSSCQILSWNVRGLNDGARRDSVNLVVRDTKSTIVCLQETKLQNIDQAVVARTLGPKFLNNFTFLPATQTRGGILLAASEDHFLISDASTTLNTITAKITMRTDATIWWITVVYGPQTDADKLLFLQELKDLAPAGRERWLMVGDFNLIYQATDKNNSNLNRRLMGSFKATIDTLHLKEIRLNGRRFTWSNGQHNPTLTRIDRFFCTPDWEILFPSCYLHSLPSTMSDHTPLLLQGELNRTPSSFFRFENYLTNMEGFYQIVQTAWNKPVNSTQPLR